MNKSTKIIAKEELYNDINKVIKETNNTTVTNYLQHGKYSKAPIRRFGGWNKILIDLGYKINMHKGKITKQDIINDYNRLEKEFGKVTSVIQRKYGNYSQKIIDDLFGSFSNLQKFLNKQPCARSISDQDIYQDILKIYNEYGFLSYNLLKNECIASWPTIFKRLGSLGEICYHLNIPIEHYEGTSKLSKYIIKTATNIFKEEPIVEKSFDWLINPETNSKLRIDAYFPNLNIALEIDGEQHYKFIPYIHKTQEKFQQCQKLDEIKNKLLKEHNIKLIRIKESDSKQEIINKLTSK